MAIKVTVVTGVDITFKFLLPAQLNAMVKEGFEVSGICSQGPNFQMLRDKGISMYPITLKRSMSPFSDLVALWKLYRYFRHKKPDIVHTHTPKPNLLGQVTAKLAGVPIRLYTAHGFYFHDNMKAFPKWFYVTMERIAGKCSDIILSQNPEDIDTAIKLGICKSDKIRFLGNGVDLSRFDPKLFNPDFQRKKRSEIGVPEDALVVGIVGRLVREKGHLELYKAMQNIMSENEKVWLIIIGYKEPEKADRISAETYKNYGIEDRTVWLSGRDDMPPLLYCFDIFVLPSWREGFPRSAIEAAAMALPIVTTNIRGCRQVVEDGKNGLLVPVRDSSALTSAIKKLLADKQLRIKMGQASYEKSRREFDERNVCSIVLNTYKDLIEKKK